jgi:hypothetical protein
MKMESGTFFQNLNRQAWLAEPDTDVPYKDAIEMAYNEIILGV